MIIIVSDGVIFRCEDGMEMVEIIENIVNLGELKVGF